MKKGFTLIELLAVILILGIIALIAVPQVTNVIGSASRGAAETSGEHYIGAVNTKIGLNKLDSDSSNDIKDGVIDISTITVDMTGEKPTSGTVFIQNGTVKEADLEINGKPVVCDSKGKCNAYDRYIYYNTSTASHDSNGYAIAYYIKTPAKNTWLNEKPSGVYARYKILNDEVIGNPDICDSRLDFCLSIDTYSLSLKKVLDYFNFDKSTWTYSKRYSKNIPGVVNGESVINTVTYDRWITSNEIYCDFGNTETEDEEVICQNSTTNLYFQVGKREIAIVNNGSQFHYRKGNGLTCVN